MYIGSAPGDDIVDPDAIAFFSASLVNGATFSDSGYTFIHRFFKGIKRVGAWPYLDDIFLLAVDEPLNVTSLKQRHTYTAVNSPIVTANRGVQFNGTSNYLRTGFVPATHALALEEDDMRIGLYNRSLSGESNTYGAGASNGAGINIVINPRTAAGNGGGIRGSLNSPAAQTTGGTQPEGAGYRALSRKLTAVSGWRRGAFWGSATSTPNTGLVNNDVWIGGINLNGALNSPRAIQVALVDVGASFPDASMEAAYHAEIEKYMHNVGAAV